MRARSFRLSTAALLAVLTLVAPGSSRAAAVPVFNTGAVIGPAPIYIGCFEFTRTPRLTCLVARTVGEGVNVIVVSDADGGSQLGGAYEERVIVPGSLRLFVEPGRKRPSIMLDAELPRTGVIHVMSRARVWQDGFGYGSAIIPLASAYDIELDDARGFDTGLPVSGGPTIGGETVESGSIDGLSVSARRSVSIYSTVPAIARWVFLLT